MKALLLVLAAGFILCCSPAVCDRIEVHRYPAPEYGPKAHKVVQKCEKGETTWYLREGTPACMEACW